MAEQVLSVPEVHCGHCVESIEGAVGALQGVSEVKVDLDSKDVRVNFDDQAISIDRVIEAIVGQGYDVGDGPKVIELGERPQQ
ncbi:MAG: heavy-metal-associated domain-containing protein [Actinomycetota bacterium]